MRRVKEPLFFAVEGRREPFHGFEDNQGIRNLSDYCALFSETQNERVIGEASPMYLYLNSEQAPRASSTMPRGQAHRRSTQPRRPRLLAFSLSSRPEDRAPYRFLRSPRGGSGKRAERMVALLAL